MEKNYTLYWVHIQSHDFFSFYSCSSSANYIWFLPMSMLSSIVYPMATINTITHLLVHSKSVNTNMAKKISMGVSP
jgi:hypothetical protein